MLWLASPTDRAEHLPAAWLIATGARPANLDERSALRRGIAREVLARQLGLPVDGIAIGHEPDGRPLLAEPREHHLHLSLATRVGLVAAALANQPVGIDVETVEPEAKPPLALLHAGERDMLQSLPPPARPRAFAQLWSAKEAYVKALGTGFRRSPESFLVRLVGLARFQVEDPERTGKATGSSRIIENGGHQTMAAAFILLD